MTRKREGFTLIELLIVIVIIGAIAAIAIPSLMRARISANEAGCVADIRTVISAEVGYRSANGGYYDVLSCLSDPSNGCIPNYPSSAPTFLDSYIGRLQPKSGYSRSFTPGVAPVPLPPASSPSSIEGYTYVGLPLTQHRTGVRGLAGGDGGVICQTPDGTDPAGGAATLPAGCNPI